VPVVRAGLGAAGLPGGHGHFARAPQENDAPSDTCNTTFRYASDAAVRAVGYEGSPPDCSSPMPIVATDAVYQDTITATITF
jgi:hypothetical protein